MRFHMHLHMFGWSGTGVVNHPALSRQLVLHDAIFEPLKKSSALCHTHIHTHQLSISISIIVVLIVIIIITTGPCPR